MTMKLLPIFFLAVAGIVLVQARYVSINLSMGLTLSEEPKRLTDDMIRICAKETEMSMEELQRFNNNDFHNSTESTQCFAHCMYEQLGMIKEGVFVEQDLIGDISSALDAKHHVPRECRALKGANKCESAFKMHKCAHQLKSKPAINV